MIANANRDPKKKRIPYSPHDFFRRPGAPRVIRGTPLTGDAFRSMKALFTKKK